MNYSEAQTELSRRSLIHFAQRVYPGYLAPRHLVYLAGLLEDLESGKFRRLVVSIGPRHGKSTLASQIFSSYFIGRNPTKNVILASHSQSLADMHSRRAKQIVESPEWPFPRVKLASDSTAVGKWNVEQGGGVFAIGVSGGVTGRGASGILICDDLLNSGHSQVDKDNAWKFFTEILIPRLDPGGRILLISARLAQDDVIGRLMEHESAREYRWVQMPAICTDELSDPLGRERGKPMWPEVFGLDELEMRREAMGIGAFEAQFQCDPSIAAGGKLFRLEHFPAYEVVPRPKALQADPLDLFYDDPLKAAWEPSDTYLRITTIDAAGIDNTSSGGSYHAMVSTMYNVETGDLYVMDVERWRSLTREALIANVTRHLDRNRPDWVGIEEMSGGGYLGGYLARNTRWPVKMLHPKTSKTERALLIVGPFAESGKTHLPTRAPWLDMFRREIADFEGTTTDMVDAWVWNCLMCRQLAAYRQDQKETRHLQEHFSLFR
jgi:phage terminase large subunit-like protein